jgi:hypothetical protein
MQALLAHSYGAAGVSAFNFVYTRPYFDVPCQFEINKPYSEPLWAALNKTKDIDFLTQSADQLYRLGHTRTPGPGQLSQQAGRKNPTYRLVFVAPTLPAKWATTGRLRLLVDAANISCSLNGVLLRPTSNVSSQYDEGVQAELAVYPPSSWRAFDVQSGAAAKAGNNTLACAVSGGGGEAGYTLSHDAAAGGDGKRWKFPAGHEPRSHVNGTSSPGCVPYCTVACMREHSSLSVLHCVLLTQLWMQSVYCSMSLLLFCRLTLCQRVRVRLSLLECEQLCDKDAQCKGIYVDNQDCFALHELLVDTHTARTGQSYTKTGTNHEQHDAVPGGSAPPILRLELSLPVVPGALREQSHSATLRTASGAPVIFRATPVKSDDAISTNLTVQLQQSQSTRPCAVVQIEQVTVPAATQWFCLRGISPHWAFPDRMHPEQNCSPTCAKDVEQWFARTQRNGTQDHAFYGSQSTISGSGARTVNTFVVEAWTARTDLGDKARAQLLATSPPLTFTFDDKGFSESVDMGLFSAQDGEPGESTVFALPNRTNAAWQQVETITWSGFHFREYVTSGGVTRPAFAFSEGVLFQTFTPRQHRTVHVNISFSSPGIYYLGMFGVWNGVYGAATFALLCVLG